MNILERIKKGIKHPRLFLLFILDWCPYIVISDKLFLRIKFRLLMGYKLNLKNPQTFNEKLQWLKLYNRRPEYTQMVDKYEAKKYVANIIGKEYIIPTIYIYKAVDEIIWDKLPQQFVMKCTHDSGGVVICKDKNKFNFEDAKNKLKLALKRSYYPPWREWPYKNVRHRIIVEEYLENIETKELMDYKFFCFNGIVKILKVDFNRFVDHHANYYDREMHLLPFGEVKCMPKTEIVIRKPINFDKMLDLAEAISKNIPFLRVDFYNIAGRIYFGEATFFPDSGMGEFSPKDWNKRLGGWISILK